MKHINNQQLFSRIFYDFKNKFYACEAEQYVI